MSDIYNDMDRLDGEAGDAVDELLAGRGVAPGCELCDPSVGRTDGDPARGLVEDDLGLAGPGEPEPEERALEEVDTIVADTGVEATPTVSTDGLGSILDDVDL
jgi:hypothetical protein